MFWKIPPQVQPFPVFFFTVINWPYWALVCAGVLEGCCRGRVPQSQGTFLPHYHCPQEFRYILNSFHSTAVHSKLWAAAMYIVQCSIYGSVGSVTFSGFGSFWEVNSGFGSLKKYYMDTDWFTVMKIIPVYMFKFLFLRYCIRFTCLDLDPFVRSKEWIRIRNNGKAWSGSGPGPGPGTCMKLYGSNISCHHRNQLFKSANKLCLIEKITKKYIEMLPQMIVLVLLFQYVREGLASLGRLYRTSMRQGGCRFLPSIYTFWNWNNETLSFNHCGGFVRLWYWWRSHF